MSFPTTYHDGNPDDRNYVNDFWCWLQTQPQDAWLLFARSANWDSAEPIFSAMLKHPACDRAVAAYIFWASEPAALFGKSVGQIAASLPGMAANRAAEQGFISAELYLDRYDICHPVHDFIRAANGRSDAFPLAIPDAFFGPFDGRMAQICSRFDDETEAGLNSVLGGTLGYLPRSEADFRKNQRDGGNMWLADRFELPRIGTKQGIAITTLPPLERLEAIYGRSADYAAARNPKRQTKAWYKSELLMLGLFGIVAMAVAIIARYLKTGLWL